ncbi:hypothetical protein H4J61_00125 [Colwellia sp. MB3u-4]|nr:hypothetical protein [Colwellia sp. MB3u-4]
MKYKKLLKKFEMEMILTIPWNVSLKNVDVWFQDEARFGQQNITTRLWATKGTRPRAVNSSLSMLIFLVLFALQQEIPRH